jgi:hypothetical protein
LPLFQGALGRHACEFHDLSGHVRLVGVAGGNRDVAEPRLRVGFGEGEQLLKANDSLKGLGAVTHGRDESSMELPLADADVARECLDPAGLA